MTTKYEPQFLPGCTDAWVGVGKKIYTKAQCAAAYEAVVSGGPMSHETAELAVFYCLHPTTAPPSIAYHMLARMLVRRDKAGRQ